MWALYIDYSICLELYEYADKNNIRIMFVIDNTEYVTMYTINDNQKLLDKDNFLSVLNDKVKQVMIIGSDIDKINDFRMKIVNDYNLNIVDTSYSDTEVWFSVVNDGTSKGNALIKLANYLNIPVKKTIAMGNDMNDISMLEVAGIGVVVDNASDDVGEHADEIIESNDDDGVALYLEKLLNITEDF